MLTLAAISSNQSGRPSVRAATPLHVVEASTPAGEQAGLFRGWRGQRPTAGRRGRASSGPASCGKKCSRPGSMLRMRSRSHARAAVSNTPVPLASPHCAGACAACQRALAAVGDLKEGVLLTQARPASEHQSLAAVGQLDSEVHKLGLSSLVDTSTASGATNCLSMKLPPYPSSCTARARALRKCGARSKRHGAAVRRRACSITRHTHCLLPHVGLS